MSTLTYRDAHGHRLIALWITAGGGVATVLLAAAEAQRHRELAWLLEGSPTRVALSERTDLWLNRDGLGRWGPNPMATRVAGTFGHDRYALHGPAVLAAQAPTADLTRGLDATAATLLASLAFYGAAEGPLRPDEVDGHRFRSRRLHLGDSGRGRASCST